MARSSKRAIWISLALAGILVRAPVALAVPCVADCNFDGAVTVNEMVAAVRTFTGDLDRTSCLHADANQNGSVTVEELVSGVRALLEGCTEHCGNAVVDIGEGCDGKWFSPLVEGLVAWVGPTGWACTEECEVCVHDDGCRWGRCCNERLSCTGTNSSDDPGTCMDCNLLPLECRCASDPWDEVCLYIATNGLWDCLDDATQPGCEAFCTIAANEGQPCATLP